MVSGIVSCLIPNGFCSNVTLLSQRTEDKTAREEICLCAPRISTRLENPISRAKWSTPLPPRMRSAFALISFNKQSSKGGTVAVPVPAETTVNSLVALDHSWYSAGAVFYVLLWNDRKYKTLTFISTF